jgi:hypothetical protein
VLDFLFRKYGRLIRAEPYASFDLLVYELPPAVDFAIAESVEPWGADFGGQLQLEGVAFGGSSLQDTSTAEEVQSPTLPSGKEGWVVLHWRALRDMDRDYKVAVYLLDGQGRVAGQVDRLLLSNRLDSTSRWQPDQREMDYYTLPSVPGTAPGEYTLEVAVYDTESGARLQVLDTDAGVSASSLSVGSLRVIRPLTPPQLEPMERLPADKSDVAPGLQLLGYDQLAEVANPGETARIGLYWRATEDLSQDFHFSIQLTDENGHVWLEQDGRPVDGTYPTTEWREGEVLIDWHDMRLPPHAPQGLHQLELKVSERGEIVGQASLGHLEIQGRPRLFAAPEIQYPLEARVGEGILFLGYNLSSDEVRPGDSLQLTLYWQALDEMQVSYTVFTHLLDAEEHVWGQMDSIPARGGAPTTSWLEDEIVSDDYDIVVDADAPPGEYVVEIGMYQATTGERLTVSGPRGEALGDRIVLEGIRVLPAN